MLSAQEALERLQRGNKEYLEDNRKPLIAMDEKVRTELLEGQAPFAVILGCSDSRVPVEIIFHQGLGDLFVIRVAGNVVSPSQIGSVEFAAANFGTPLVVVLGHSGCGAIAATVEQLMKDEAHRSKNLQIIVDKVSPAVEPLLKTELKDDLEALKERAVRENVRLAVENLRKGSDILEDLVQQNKLTIVGAEYCLKSGVIDFFEGVPIA